MASSPSPEQHCQPDACLDMHFPVPCRQMHASFKLGPAGLCLKRKPQQIYQRTCSVACPMLGARCPRRKVTHPSGCLAACLTGIAPSARSKERPGLPCWQGCSPAPCLPEEKGEGGGRGEEREEDGRKDKEGKGREGCLLDYPNLFCPYLGAAVSDSEDYWCDGKLMTRGTRWSW